MENAFEKSKPEENSAGKNREETEMKQPVYCSSSVTKVKEFIVPEIKEGYHMSIDTMSGKIWLSNSIGNLVQIDLEGNRLRGIKSRRGFGYHKVTKDGYLIYTDKDKKAVNRITTDNEITEITKTGDWEPISIHSSLFNEDILVGMRNDEEAKIIRYNKTGKEIQRIQIDNKDKPLYSDPHYITENINCDICTSDYEKQAVVVVNELGQHKFSYTDKKSIFRPWGICTDTLGHIFVCDECSNTVHHLDKDGRFLSHLITLQQGVKYPRCVCLDVENNLYVGQSGQSSVAVYKYLH